MLYIEPCLSANREAKKDRRTCFVSDSVLFGFYWECIGEMKTSIHRHPS